jgi:hypothetical protein
MYRRLIPGGARADGHCGPSSTPSWSRRVDSCCYRYSVAGFLNLVVGFFKSHLNSAKLTAFQPKDSIIGGFEQFSVGFLTKWISHTRNQLIHKYLDLVLNALSQYAFRLSYYLKLYQLPQMYSPACIIPFKGLLSIYSQY